MKKGAGAVIQDEKLEALEKKIDRNAEKTDAAFDKMYAKLQNLERWVHSLRGSDLEKSMPQRIGSYLYTEMNLRNPVMLFTSLHEMDRSLLSALQNAGDSGLLTHDECSRIFNTDIILKAFTADGKEVWLAFEISATINDDIERSLESADIIQRLIGTQAVAAVAGCKISVPQAERAKKTGVEVFIVKSA